MFMWLTGDVNGTDQQLFMWLTGNIYMTDTVQGGTSGMVISSKDKPRANVVTERLLQKHTNMAHMKHVATMVTHWRHRAWPARSIDTVTCAGARRVLAVTIGFIDVTWLSLQGHWIRSQIPAPEDLTRHLIHWRHLVSEYRHRYQRQKRVTVNLARHLIHWRHLIRPPRSLDTVTGTSARGVLPIT